MTERKRPSAYMRALQAKRDADRQRAAKGANEGEDGHEREEDHEAPSRTPWLPKRRRPYWR